MNTRKIRIVLVMLFATTFALLSLPVAIAGHAPWWFIAMQASFAFLVVAPAFAFVRGVAWCRRIVAAEALLFLFLWTLLPLAQHAIDRHAWFWAVWSFLAVITAGAAWASLKKENSFRFEVRQK